MKDIQIEGNNIGSSRLCLSLPFLPLVPLPLPTSAPSTSSCRGSQYY